MGPLSLGFDELVGMRLNEHAFHTWDIAVVLDEAAGLPEDAAALVVDNLSLIARFSGRPMARSAPSPSAPPTPSVTSPCASRPTAWRWVPGEPGQSPDLELPAEAFCRLVYGRLDPDHTPAFTGTPRCVDTLRGRLPRPARPTARARAGRRRADRPPGEELPRPAGVGEDGACPSPT